MDVSWPTPEVYLHWNLVRECNFTCDYCVVKASQGRVEAVDIARIVQRLDQLGRTLLVSFSGGEPFLVPNFTELCIELARNHFLRIDTNLSVRKSCEHFMHGIDPRRVTEICYSTHVVDRERRSKGVQELCSLVSAFQERGFRMVGNYVAWPPLLSRMERDLEYFRAEGMTVYPTLFWGEYAGKQYPSEQGVISYSPADWNFIRKRNPAADSQLQEVKHSYCQAGSRAFTVTEKYEVIPCDGIHKRRSDFFGEWHEFQKVIRCPHRYCTCPVNRPPAVPYCADDHPNTVMLRRAVAEIGTYSVPQSYKAIDGSYLPWIYRTARDAYQRSGLARRARQGSK